MTEPEPEPEPAANPQALTEAHVAALTNIRDKLNAGVCGQREIWVAQLNAAIEVLSRPAADRGQIVEECARVADRYARQLGSRLGRQAASDITASIRALSPAPAPAQTEK